MNGAAVWANGYLPAAYQGTLLREKGALILNLGRPHSLTEATPTLYGLDDSKVAGFGRQCLLARRLMEWGVRYTMLLHGVQIGSESWDHHGKVRDGMKKNAREVDQPVGPLLEDLKQRGLLGEALVVWASEMGRIPFVNGSNPGREHNSRALCMWMAEGDVKGEVTVGATDEYSLRSVGGGDSNSRCRWHDSRPDGPARRTTDLSASRTDSQAHRYRWQGASTDHQLNIALLAYDLDGSALVDPLVEEAGRISIGEVGDPHATVRSGELRD